MISRIQIVQRGGITAIIKAMDKYLDHVYVQAHGCLALGELAGTGTGWWSNDDTKLNIAKQGGIDAIINALSTYPDHARVQEGGKMALKYLAENENNKHEIIKKGGKKYV